MACDRCKKLIELVEIYQQTVDQNIASLAMLAPSSVEVAQLLARTQVDSDETWKRIRQAHKDIYEEK